MQIVIDIPKEIYESVRYYNGLSYAIEDYLHEVEWAIKNGTPLPKGHGRLIDASRLKTHFVGTEQGTDLEVYLESTLINAPTIIEADEAESEIKK